jgi:hypothetical protein
MWCRGTIRRFVIAQASLALILASSAMPARAEGNVLPATAKPSGYSLEDMAEELAYFSTSGNDLSEYPDTPFQILYVNRNTGTDIVPVAYIDDSPLILGNFPTSPSQTADYVFSPEQLGGHDFAIVVDGKATPLGPAYAAGPVFAPGLLDGGGSHFIQIGGFLTPLPKGTHTVTIQGTFDGAALGGSSFSFVTSYTVIVE